MVEEKATIDDFVKKEAERVRAMETSNAVDYAVLCGELGKKEEDIERPELYEQGLAEIATTEVYEFDEKRELYSKFISQAKKQLQYLPDAVFRDIDAKRALLRSLGYTYLKGPARRGIPLSECDDERIGKAFWNCYKAAQNYIKAPR
jgi:hypothetical protein